MKAPICLIFLGMGVVSAGCGADGNDGASGETVDGVEIALTVVPAGVQCVRVTATVGGTTQTPPLVSVMPGASSASLSVGQLPAGNATFNGAAFNVPCSSVTSSTVPNWIATPVTSMLVVGLNNQISLVFLPNNAVGVSANFLSAPTDLSVGVTSSRVRLADGTVREWGVSIAGALENPPGGAPGITDAVQVASGGQNAVCERTSAGNVVCAGSGNLLGVPPGTFTFTPVMLTFPISSASSPINQLSLGVAHACALQRMTVTCWGDNSFGQFGNGSTTSSGAPIFVGNAGASKVFAGNSNTCFLKGDGSLQCTGANGNGQLGNNSMVASLTPVTVTGLTDTIDAAVGNAHACALRSDGTVRCWGSNASGQLGDGTTTTRLVPVQVLNITDAVRVVAGADHTCVLRQNGAVSCWGKGVALGDGIGNNRSTPADVAGLSGTVALDAHLGNHSCAIASDRSVKCWGDNSVGQVDGSFVFAGKPVTVVLQ